MIISSGTKIYWWKKKDDLYGIIDHLLSTTNDKIIYFCKGYTVTYDPMTAYALRKTYPVLAWGKKRKNNRAFVFDKPHSAVVGF